ncbi:cytochrome c oxidase assembly protein, partial [Frankia sp. ACN1ag]|uniref:cytochrome c oxidase assembly protein n=1 Tax=Frankia sp. ACN1ag TaxID=102891 RepID=UPI0037BE5A83
MGAPARRRKGRHAGVAGAAAVVVLILVAALAAWIAQRRPGPVLPVSWCRWGQGGTLPPLTPGRLLDTWQLDAVALAFLLPVTALYLWGVARVRARHPARPWPWPRTAAFLASVAVVVLSTSSVVGVYDQTLFSIHMAQHLMLIMVAPSLFVAGRPLTLLLHSTRNPLHTRARAVIRSRALGVLFSPAAAFTCYTITIVGTHLTGFMDQAMARP